MTLLTVSNLEMPGCGGLDATTQAVFIGTEKKELQSRSRQIELQGRNPDLYKPWREVVAHECEWSRRADHFADSGHSGSRPQRIRNPVTPAVPTPSPIHSGTPEEARLPPRMLPDIRLDHRCQCDCSRSSIACLDVEQSQRNARAGVIRDSRAPTHEGKPVIALVVVLPGRQCGRRALEGGGTSEH